MIGIFGGTFDPIHTGHLSCLEMLSKELNFGRVHWVLSARPPHKESVSSTIEQRFAMLKLVLADFPTFEADDTEIKRAEQSYTYYTLQEFRERYPNESLCMIVGADSIENITSWHRYQELISIVNIVVMHRPGYQKTLPEFLRDRQVANLGDLNKQLFGAVGVFTQPKFDVSSTEIRHRLALGQAVKGFLPPQVIKYIQKHKLYQPKPDK